MLVGEVKPERLPGASDSEMLSAGRPVAGTVIASRLCQVSRAQRCRREFEAPGSGAVGAPASACGESPSAASIAAPPTMTWRRSGVPSPRWTRDAAVGLVEESGTFGSDMVGSDMVGLSFGGLTGHRGVRWPVTEVDYLMPVVAMPSMNLRWKARKISRMGMTTTVAPARSRP